jgi:hypothetical protein
LTGKEARETETAALIMSVTALTIAAYQIGVQVSNWKYQKLMSSLAEQLRKDQNDFFIRMWELVSNSDTPFSDNWKWKGITVPKASTIKAEKIKETRKYVASLHHKV